MDMINKLKKIKLLVLDVDGVLTDSKITYLSDGQEVKNFDVQDGYGIVLLRRAGIKTAIISARKAKPVTIRAKDLNIDKVYQNAYPKLAVYKKMIKELRLKDDQVCFIGDDVPDLPLLKKVGLSVSVPNACADVKRAVDYVTKKKGGYGAVREIIEMILKTQGQWKKILKNGG